MYRKLASVVLVAAVINAKYAAALGLGEMTMHSALNQPLSAEIKLANVGDLDETQILVNIAAESEFAKSGIERTFFLTGIKFDVVLDENGQSVIKLRSEKSVKEPFLDFLIEARWPAGRVIKSYTALIDLPVYTDNVSQAVDLSSSSASQVPADVYASESSAEQASYEENANVEVSTIDEHEVTSEPAAFVESDSVYSDETYTVQSGDTMYEVAQHVVPSSDVSVEQAMLALQAQNPRAFIGGNINRLKAGAVLRVPTMSEITEVSARSALAAIGRQNREWREAQLEASDDHYTPMQAAPTEDGHLSLASAGTGLANGSDADGAAESGAAVNAEELEVAKQENLELEGRVQSLGDQIDDLQRMIELKDAELAALQQKLSKDASVSDGDVLPEDVAQAEVAVTEEVVAESVIADSAADAIAAVADDVATQEDVKAEEVDSADSEAEADSDSSIAGSEAQTESVVDEVESVEAPVVEEPVAVEPEEDATQALLSQLMSNPMYIGVAGLLIALIVVMLLMRRRSNAEQDAFDDIANFEFEENESQDEVEPGVEASDALADADMDAEPELPVQEVEEEVVEEVAEPTVMQTGDAIGEADIYIAYGRYDQAVELLEGAIASASSDVALRTKLLEVHVESNNKDGFQQQFAQLEALGDESAVVQVKELLTSADKSDWLDGVSADVSVVVGAIDDLESLDADLAFDEVDLALSDPMPEDDVAMDLDEISLDLDLDVSDVVDSAEIEAAADDLSDFDLAADFDADLSLDLDAVDDLSAELAVSELDDDLSLDLSSLDETILDMPAVTEEDLSVDLDGLDISLDLDLAEESESKSEIDLSLDGEFDLSLDDDLDFSVESEEPAEVEPAVTELEPAESTSVSALEGDDLAFLTDADEVSTKLDLARAYVDMGDVDGARDILMEVMKEGDDTQKSEATALIDGLD